VIQQYKILQVGMLNDYQIFDYRIKCLFSFSSVSYSILELLMHCNVGQEARWQMVNNTLHYWHYLIPTA